MEKPAKLTGNFPNFAVRIWSKQSEISWREYFVSGRGQVGKCCLSRLIQERDQDEIQGNI